MLALTFVLNFVCWAVAQDVDRVLLDVDDSDLEGIMMDACIESVDVFALEDLVPVESVDVPLECSDDGNCRMYYADVLLYGGAAYDKRVTNHYITSNYIMSFERGTTKQDFMDAFDWTDTDKEGVWLIMERMLGVVVPYPMGKGTVVKVGSAFLLNSKRATTAWHVVYKHACSDGHALLSYSYDDMDSCPADQVVDRLPTSWACHDFRIDPMDLMKHDRGSFFPVPNIVEHDAYNTDLAVLEFGVNYPIAGLEDAGITLHECQAGDKVVFFGFPSKIDRMVTKNGVLNLNRYGDFYYPHRLSVGKGKILRTRCTFDDGFEFDFEGLIWKGWSGGVVALRENPKKICGSISSGDFKVRTDNNEKRCTRHIGICSNHPMFDVNFDNKQEL